MRKIGYFLTKRPNINLVLAPDTKSPRPRGIPASLGASVSGSDRSGEISRGRAPSGASVLGISCLSLRSSGRRVGRRVRRFLERGLGRRQRAAKSPFRVEYYFPHSLGIFYQALTQYLGFPHYGDEYKVMGLAPYGRASFLDAMRKIVRLLPDGGFELDLKFFRHHREDDCLSVDGRIPEFGDLFSPALEELLGPRRAADRSARGSASRHRSLGAGDVRGGVLSSARRLQKRSGLTELALAGGCAMNSVANGKVRRMTPFRRVYVQAAAGDAGGAIGAAFAVWHKLGGKRTFVMDHAYWGPPSVLRRSATLLSSSRIGDFCRWLYCRRNSRRSRSCAGAPPRRSRTARSSAGFRAGWNGVRARSAIARSCAIRAAPT